MQGTADIQVKSHDAGLLAAAMPQAIRKDLNNATHVLKRDVEGQPFATYRDRTLPLHPELTPSIMHFVQNGRALLQ